MTKAISSGIRKSSERIAAATGKGIEKGAGRAVRQLGHGTEQVAKNAAEAEAKHVEHLHSIHPSLPTKEHLRSNLPDKPVYLLGDKGVVKRLTPEGPKALTDEDRKLLGGSLKLDSNDSVGRRPKNPDNPYSWEHDDQPKEKRPRKSSKEIPVGSDELSRATQLARHEQNSFGNYKRTADGEAKFSSNNYAAIHVRNSDAENPGEFIMVGRSSNPVHSEKVLGIPFLESGHGDRIQSLYTEREPCSESSDCSAWMEKWMPHVDVTHSIEYGPDPESQARGNRGMEDYLNRMIPGVRTKNRSAWAGHA